jgi:putative CocE/NonD family hydrolase
MPDITLESDVAATMRDGTVLRADVYRPKTSVDLPVLLMRLPYDKRRGASTFGQAHPAWYARHGYAVVMQDSRGSGTSDGEFYPFLYEQQDGYDSVEWAATLPGTTGQVGMFGFSYVGATQLLAAVERPPHLSTVIPGFTASQYYDGWTYQGGALSLAFVAYWSNLLGMQTASRAGDLDTFSALNESLSSAADWFWHLPLEEYPPLLDRGAPYFFDWLAHPTNDDYWTRWSIEEDYQRIEVPAMHIGGWYDIFIKGTVRNFVGMQGEAGSEAARTGQKLLIGPWTHMPWTPLGDSEGDPPTANYVDEWQIRWFDQFLKGRDTGVLEHPVTLHLWNGPRQEYDGWPPSGAKREDWYAHSDGRANSKFGDGILSREAPVDEPPDLFIYEPTLPTPSLGGHSCCYDSITPMGPADQHVAEVSKMMLVYTSPPLQRSMTVVGDVEVILFAASTAPDTDFTARICAVDLEGRSTNLAEGIVRGRYRESLTEARPMRPGDVYEFRIPLGPVGARITAGWRLRLDIASSDFPQWDRNLNTGGALFQENVLAGQLATQTVLHDQAHPTRVSLYVVE